MRATSTSSGVVISQTPEDRHHQQDEQENQQPALSPSSSSSPPSSQNPVATTGTVLKPKIGSRLFSSGMAREARKRQWIEEEKLKGELRALQLEDCTFAPSITKRAASLNRPRNLAPENRIGVEIQNRLIKLSEKRQEQMKKELEPCTFHPLTLDVARLARDRPRSAGPRRYNAMITNGTSENVNNNNENKNVFDTLYEEAKVRTAWQESNRQSAANNMLSRTGKRANAPQLSKKELEQVVLRLMNNKPATSATSASNSNNNNKPSAHLLPDHYSGEVVRP